MAPYGVSISKRVTWRGTVEEFSNVYHFDIQSLITTDAGWDALIDAVAAIEKPAFGSVVTFFEGRAWGPTNQGQVASITRRIKTLTGAGTQPGTASVPFEMALVWSKYIGRNPATQKKRFLRKYLHICRASSTASEASRLGNDVLGANEIAIAQTHYDSIKVVTVGPDTHKLCSPAGVPYDADNTPVKILPHLHVRQFKQ